MFINRTTMGASALFVGIAGTLIQLVAVRGGFLAALPLFATISGLSMILAMGPYNAAASQTEAPQ
ncbi:hypothetical protein [Roseovarius arcticus]|uniref:hypothetical protein n=1 Tax=Roseovarius arcticus TaxID=2547404 RepID=UPI001110B0DB|nr:hypothetical protein [Roseovarius arcticus]